MSSAVEFRLLEMVKLYSSLDSDLKTDLLHEFNTFLQDRFETIICSMRLDGWNPQLMNCDVKKSRRSYARSVDKLEEMEAFMNRLIYTVDEPNIYYRFVESRDDYGRPYVDLILSRKLIFLSVFRV